MKAPIKSIELTQVIEWNDGTAGPVEDYLSVEEPLEIRVNGEPLTITMRTPGHDIELAAGLLLSEGVVRSADELTSLAVARANSKRLRNVVDVLLHDIGELSRHLHRNFITNSSCGICGRSSIESIRMREFQRPSSCLHLNPEILCGLPDKLRGSQAVFRRTGGLHAAALFSTDGELLVLREDIGRHNAVDKVIGWALLENHFPLSNGVLMVSGRGGFEIVQKALAAGIPLLASISAPSSLAVQLAREFGLTLIGFLRGRRFIVYSHAERCIIQEEIVG